MNTWVMLRAAGIGAYLMLFGTVSWGLIGTTSLFGKRISRATSIAVHQFLAAAALILIGLHLTGLALDKVVHFRTLDLLVPGTSAFKTGAVATGVVAMYAAVVVLGSSWLRKRMSTKAWRALHLGAVPAFALALVHGIWAGTDSARPWMFAIYMTTGTIVMFLMLTRVLTVDLRPERQAPPPGARPRPPRPPGLPAASARVPQEPRTEPHPRRPASEHKTRELAGSGARHHPYKPAGSQG